MTELTGKKMRAAVMYGPNDIRVEMIDKPECPHDGLILKIMTVGLCGSDIRNLTSDSRKGDYPFVYGHEIVGIVDEIGVDQTTYKIGDRLFIFPGTYCMKCDSCISGHSENCINVEKGLAGTGGFAQFIAIQGRKIELGGIYKIPDDVTYQAASLGEPLTSVYACLDNIKVSYGHEIVIVGAGPIGCFMAQLSKMRGATKVIMIDINASRLQKSLEFGVDFIINSATEDPVRKVKELTAGLGADIIISANPSTEAQEQSVFMAKMGGLVVLFGGVPKGKLTKIDSNYIHYNNIWIKGHFGASFKQSKEAYELAISKDFPTDKFITHELPLEQINEGIELTKTGEALKVVLMPHLL